MTSVHELIQKVRDGQDASEVVSGEPSVEEAFKASPKMLNGILGNAISQAQALAKNGPKKDAAGEIAKALSGLRGKLSEAFAEEIEADDEDEE